MSIVNDVHNVHNVHDLYRKEKIRFVVRRFRWGFVIVDLTKNQIIDGIYRNKGVSKKMAKFFNKNPTQGNRIWEIYPKEEVN